ncbi:MAG: cache domain-containing protein [Lachnospiraceae bacterium]|nr:cache domain-containing protein [Lachnospiraceae bacterium]
MAELKTKTKTKEPKPKKVKAAKVKKEKGTKIKTIKTKLLWEFLGISLLPMTILGVVLTVYSSISLNKGLEDRSMDSLKAVAETTLASINFVYNGGWTIDPDGNVFKGGARMTDNNQIFINVKNKSDMDVSLYYKGFMVATSLALRDEYTEEEQELMAQGKHVNSHYVGQEAPENITKDVFETGNDATYDSFDLEGVDCYAYCLPIQNSAGATQGMLLVTMEKKEITAYIVKSVSVVVALALVLFVLMALLSAKLTQSMVRAILINKGLVDKMETGDLNIVATSEIKHLMKRKDEIGQMIVSMSKLHNQLCIIVNQMKNVANNLVTHGSSLESVAREADNTTSGIGVAVAEVAKGASHQAGEVTDATGNISQMGNLIKDIVSSVETLTKHADDMLAAQDISKQQFDRLSQTNENTKEAIASMSDQIAKTNTSIKYINEAVDMISSIADQTTLLSLNASIEAARAGEAGRGFSVVASEIQKLANESNESATRIKANIAEVITNSSNTMAEMENMKATIDEQIKSLDETIEQFDQLAAGVRATTDEAKNIEMYANKCDDARVMTEEIMNTLASISEENASGAEETTASMDTLTETVSHVAESSAEIDRVAKEINKTLEFFKLDDSVLEVALKDN